jgi:hypothetical protein
MTANLQFTVRQAARLMNVSERSVYMARKVQRLRPDLADAVIRGEISLNRAYLIATGRPSRRQRRCPHCGEALP